VTWFYNFHRNMIKLRGLEFSLFSHWSSYQWVFATTFNWMYQCLNSCYIHYNILILPHMHKFVSFSKWLQVHLLNLVTCSRVSIWYVNKGLLFHWKIRRWRFFFLWRWWWRRKSPKRIYLKFICFLVFETSKSILPSSQWHVKSCQSFLNQHFDEWKMYPYNLYSWNLCMLFFELKQGLATNSWIRILDMLIQLIQVILSCHD
jgi:hypothetical protein